MQSLRLAGIRLAAVTAQGQVWQQLPAVKAGSSPFSHMSGKHQTFGHSTDFLPPYFPVAPSTGASQPTFGFTQYGQQWPGTSVGRKVAGQVRSPQVLLSQGSFAVNGWRAFCTMIKPFWSWSRARIIVSVRRLIAAENTDTRIARNIAH